jgi:hypothetical protein
MPSNDDRFQPHTVEARYTASDAANFSRQGACMTALPPDETYHLRRIEDLPPPYSKQQDEWIRRQQELVCRSKRRILRPFRTVISGGHRPGGCSLLLRIEGGGERQGFKSYSHITSYSQSAQSGLVYPRRSSK